MDITYLQIVVNFVVLILDSVLGIFVGGSLLAFVPEDILYYVLLGLTFAAWVAVFVLQGLGIYRMAKNRGIKKRALAFIPFVNLWYMGKLAGTCSFYGQKIKRAGLYTMLVQIISSVLSILQMVGLVYLMTKYGALLLNDNGQLNQSIIYGTFDNFIFSFIDISGLILLILAVVYCFMMNILMSGIYKQYAPGSYRMLGLLTLICPPSRGIVMFVMRNRKAIDYEAYIKARHEEYLRRQQQYYSQYGNPYGRPNPYGQNPYGTQNPYGQAPNPQAYRPEPKKPEDPFEEFADSEEKTNTESTKNSTDSDDFFS